MSFEEGSFGFMKCSLFLKKLYILKISMNVVIDHDIYMCCVSVYDDVLHLQAEIKES
jgi:hypothetical protein